jgi:hypothetical protein
MPSLYDLDEWLAATLPPNLVSAAAALGGHARTRRGRERERAALRWLCHARVIPSAPAAEP